ncbi:c-type cytochrome [Thalassotalea mangrovi]|uniref:Cytochrome c domain-containing protein n=1 Tax=Thalassotalea mangrovi TaxID=2572245 RepID=A0A4V5NUA5_9GAMM|nr:c-type cytochrome [Thalassotalea mangrovi]TKB45575.1 hypothetical protein E8M12_08235 [Thalassotalea mangrovi]
MTAPDIGVIRRLLCISVGVLIYLHAISKAFATEADEIAATLPPITEQAESSYLVDESNNSITDESKAAVTSKVHLTPAQRLRKQRRLNAQIQFCSPCHGINGVSHQALYPDLAGKSQQYLLSKLKAYKSKRTRSPIMNGMVAPLQEDDLRALADYYAQQSQPDTELLVNEAVESMDLANNDNLTSPEENNTEINP